MKLMSVSVEGFKRFEDKATIDVAPSVVALIGPNEAGKSSLLSAMLLLNSDSSIDSAHRSRGSNKDVSVSAHYVLEQVDWNALSSVPGGANIKTYKYERRLKGGTRENTYTLSPNPKRDLSTRSRRAVELERFVSSETILARFHAVGNVSISDAYEAAHLALNSTKDSLNSEEISSIQGFAKTMLKFPDIETQQSDDPSIQTVSIHFLKFVRELAQYTEGRSPSAEAAAILGARRPEFVFFTEEDRNLQTIYHLESEANVPPKALDNLARLAELDLEELQACADPSYAGKRTTLLVRANEKLKEQFKDRWPQLDLTVHIDFNLPNIEITVSGPGNTYNVVTERSAGLRSFIALRAFLSKHRTDHPPVLLVDEAETHLHYDAQANLVDMFTKQTLAAKVI